ncbi:unnamed protein product [Pieris macdunnoughi]|uniref:Pseudouridylate synthase 1 homolog n=1 Tax=Pieris macdunnoughi TaxID=345717 RepID=A0A821TY66_9NEOP|nr:unnamed protein product [Pieris macdunnoughi]
MSVRLFQRFISSIKQNLPKHAKLVKTGPLKLQIETMSVATKEIENDDHLVDKQRTRFQQRQRKRQWEFNENKKGNSECEAKKLCDQPFERIKRKKMAMLLGYCGVDYFGMQRNPGVKTIEEDLLQALLGAKYITEEDFVNQQNAQFQRSSRTDKGVSAARQVVSVKLPLEVNVDEINKRLPECIRVFGIKRVTNKFNSKSKCNARTYSYTLPTYVFEKAVCTDEERKVYRISAEKQNLVNQLLGHYKGTKSYHNFTEKKHHQDPSASRYMMSFTMKKIFIESEVEFAELLVKGQSFMLHQIRKMVGLVIVIARGQADQGMIDKAFGKEKVMIPTAPGLGLMLDKVHYERYDTRYKDSHESLTWEDLDDTIEKFKMEHIHPNVVKGEIEGRNMALWLEKIEKHSFDPNDYVMEDKDDNIQDDDDDEKVDADIENDEDEREIDIDKNNAERNVCDTDIKNGEQVEDIKGNNIDGVVKHNNGNTDSTDVISVSEDKKENTCV